MKVAIINHGAPGSGMSTMSQAIRSEMELNKLTCKIHSTDTYFMEMGKHVFQGHKLQEYHALNLLEYKHSIDADIDCVICDNTNLVQEHAQPYIDHALTHGYLVILLHFHADDCNAHMARCPYNVPRRTMSRYIQMTKYVYPVRAFQLDVRPESFYQSLLSVPKTIRKKLFGIS